MKKRFKEHLKGLKRLRVGIHEDPSVTTFLNRNERTIPYDEDTLRRLTARLKNAQLQLYPDLELFYRKLARWLSVREEELYLTEGVSGAIKSLLETLTEPDNNIVFPVPTFAMYPVYCQMFDLEHRTVGYTKEYMLDIEGLRRCIDERTAIVFLPNPNVPIEGTLDLDSVASLAEYCAGKGAFLAVDEVYYPFGGPTAIDLIRRFDNLFVMRSFSKGFGLAGIRLGYVISNSENIDYISKTRTGYETNTVSAEIASFFIDNYHFAESYIRDVKEGLSYLKKEFKRLGLSHIGGNTSNFIFVDLRDEKRVRDAVDALKAKGILVRGGWPQPYASGLCITGGPRDLMEKFIREFEPWTRT